MGNVAHRRDQKRMRPSKPAVFKDVAPAHHGAERDARSIDFHFPQLAELAQIDQKGRRGEPERKHWHQALAAGDGFCLAAMRRQKRHGFGQRLRTGIVK